MDTPFLTIIGGDMFSCCLFDNCIIMNEILELHLWFRKACEDQLSRLRAEKSHAEEEEEEVLH